MANGNLTIYVGQKMEAELKQLAERERRSVSQQITLMLEREMKRMEAGENDDDLKMIANQVKGMVAEMYKEYAAKREAGEPTATDASAQ